MLEFKNIFYVILGIMGDKEKDGALTQEDIAGLASSTGNSAGVSAIYVDSIKAMAESVGIANMDDEAAKELSEDVTHRLRIIVQDALKFMEPSKRMKLTTQDIDFSLKTKDIEVKECFFFLLTICLSFFL